MKSLMKLNVVAMVMMGLICWGASKAQADAPKTDGEIIGLIMAIDKSEIDAAHQAEGKNISPEVKDFAKMMEDQHGDNLAKLQALSTKTGIQPPATAGGMIMAKGDKGLAIRGVMNGHDFEKAYINDMVDGHSDALNLIDTHLLPDAQNSELKDFVAKTRDHVVMHLAKAKELQSKLQ